MPTDCRKRAMNQQQYWSSGPSADCSTATSNCLYRSPAEFWDSHPVFGVKTDYHTSPCIEK
jgi:hypothetical protein